MRPNSKVDANIFTCQLIFNNLEQILKTVRCVKVFADKMPHNICLMHVNTDSWYYIHIIYILLPSICFHNQTIFLFNVFMYVSVSLNNGIKLVIHIIVKLTVIRLWRILQVMLTLIVAPELRPSNISCRLKTSDPNIIRCCCWLSIVHIVQHGMTAAVATVWLSHLDTNWPQHTIAAAVEHMYSDVACFFDFTQFVSIVAQCVNLITSPEPNHNQTIRQKKNRNWI